MGRVGGPSASRRRITLCHTPRNEGRISVLDIMVSFIRLLPLTVSSTSNQAFTNVKYHDVARHVLNTTMRTSSTRMSSPIVTVDPSPKVSPTSLPDRRTRHAPFSLAPRATRVSRLRAPAMRACVPSNSVSSTPSSPVWTSSSSLIWSDIWCCRPMDDERWSRCVSWSARAREGGRRQTRRGGTDLG